MPPVRPAISMAQDSETTLRCSSHLHPRFLPQSYSASAWRWSAARLPREPAYTPMRAARHISGMYVAHQQTPRLSKAASRSASKIRAASSRVRTVFMPTSITTAPGRIYSSSIIAAPRSPPPESPRHCRRAAKSRVREWQMVTVAFSCSSNIAIGFSDDVAASHYHGIPARYGNLVALQDLHHAGRRARTLQSRPAGREQTHVAWMESIHVLLRQDSQQCLLRIDMSRQRQLNQNAIDVTTRVQLRDNRQQSFSRQRCIAHDRLVMDAQFLGCLRLVAHVDGGGGIVAHQDDRQTRCASRLCNDPRDARRHSSFNLVANQVSVENNTHEIRLSDVRSWARAANSLPGSPPNAPRSRPEVQLSAAPASAPIVPEEH